MGSSESNLRKKKYLTKEEIEVDVSRNIYLLPIFKKIKNSDGLLTTNELNTITYGLINPKIRKKIIQICGSKTDKLNLEDLCYFYSLLNTTSFEAKLNFLLDFIFIKKDKLPKEKYIHKVQKYFVGSSLLQSILLDPKLLEKSKQDRDTVYKFIVANKMEEIKKYPLYINENMGPSQDNEDDINSKDVLLLNSRTKTNYSREINPNMLDYFSGKKKQGINISNSLNIRPIKCNKYDYLKNEFEEYEKNNNGVFTISLFEEMLKEINVNQSIITIIGSYLTLKTKKSFFNFELLKEILLILIPEDNTNKENELIKGIFFFYKRIYIIPNKIGSFFN